MANEQPDYSVIKKDNEFEIRQYTNFLTATVETDGERDEAIGKGFRILFKYISGENKEKENISMTIPVMQKSIGSNKDRKSTRLNSSHPSRSRMPSSA